MGDPTPTKRKATMTTKSWAGVDDDGKDVWQTVEATDYWHVEEIEERTRLAKQAGWQQVVISDEPDAGPGGYHGQYVQLDGTVRPETPEDQR